MTSAIACEVVSFDGPAGDLHGLLYRPDGSAAFPAVLWNHGSERDPGVLDELARFYDTQGYVLFAPHRRGHGRSAGDYPIAELHDRLRAEAGERGIQRHRLAEAVIELLELGLADTLAAFDWLARRDFVDADRIAISGVSHGAIQALLAAEADAGARGYVPISPGAMAWDAIPELGERLLCAVREAAAPIFLIQAANDYSLGPSEVLGAELRRRGAPNRVHVYPAYGDSPDAGHGEFAREATAVWGADVGDFLDEVIPAADRAR
jgi:dipeptidyl aminopeptidase/acylaminoacyl peptidase